MTSVCTSPLTKCAGQSWQKIGIGNTDGNFYAVASVDADDVNVAGGQLLWYDGTSWAEFDVAPIRGLDRDSVFGLASDADGFVYGREGVGT